MPLVPHARQNRQEPQERGETLFIDARKLGTMQTRVLRILTGLESAECVEGTPDPLPTSDIGRIVYTYRQWRGGPAPAWWNKKAHGEWSFAPTPGFASAATLEEIAKQGHVLTPGRYVGAEDVEDDGEAFADKFPRMVAEFESHFAEGEKLTALVRERALGGVGNASS